MNGFGFLPGRQINNSNYGLHTARELVEVKVCSVDPDRTAFRCQAMGLGKNQIKDGVLLSASSTGFDGSQEISLPQVGQRAWAIDLPLVYIVLGFYNSPFPFSSGSFSSVIHNVKVKPGEKLTQLKDVFIHFTNGFYKIYIAPLATIFMDRLRKTLEVGFETVNVKTFGGRLNWGKPLLKQVDPNFGKDPNEFSLVLTNGYESPTFTDSHFPPLVDNPMLFNPLFNPTMQPYSDKVIVKGGTLSDSHLLEFDGRQSSTGIKKELFSNMQFGHKRDGTFYSLAFDDYLTQYSYLSYYKSIPTGDMLYEAVRTPILATQSPMLTGFERTFNPTTGRVEEMMTPGVKINSKKGDPTTPLEVIVNEQVYKFSVDITGKTTIEINTVGTVEIAADGSITASSPLASVEIGSNGMVTSQGRNIIAKGRDGVLTPNTILNGVKACPFAGIPFMGCGSVEAKDG